MTPANAILLAFAIMLGSILATGYEANHLSCERIDGLRAPARVFYLSAARRSEQRAAVDHAVKRTLDLEAHAADMRAAGLSHQIDCSQLFPATK